MAVDKHIISTWLNISSLKLVQGGICPRWHLFTEAVWQDQVSKCLLFGGSEAVSRWESIART